MKLPSETSPFFPSDWRTDTYTQIDFTQMPLWTTATNDDFIRPLIVVVVGGLLVLLIWHVGSRLIPFAWANMCRTMSYVNTNMRFRRLKSIMRHAIGYFNATMEQGYFVLEKSVHGKQQPMAGGYLILLVHDRATREDATEFSFYVVLRTDNRTISGQVVVGETIDTVFERTLGRRDWNDDGLAAICCDILEQFYFRVRQTQSTGGGGGGDDDQ